MGSSGCKRMKTPMPLRSMLFVPGDSEKKLAKAENVRADALILDLEDSVAAERKGVARELVSSFLMQPVMALSVWVRINSLATAEAARDLECFQAGLPDGFVLPKGSPADVERLGELLIPLEEQHGVEERRVRIMPIATETPAAVLAVGEYHQRERVFARLEAISWGAEDLCAALGAETNVDSDGEWLPTYQLARSLCLLGAHAASVVAIDTIHRDFRDTQGLRRHASRARRDGFAGKLAIHPDQVEIINEAFRPSEQEIAYARRVIEAFEQAPQTGVIALENKMLDVPHLRQAQRVLALAESDSD